MRKLIICLFALLVSCGSEVMPQRTILDGGDTETVTDSKDSENVQDSGSVTESDTGTVYEKTEWRCLICE